VVGVEIGVSLERREVSVSTSEKEKDVKKTLGRERESVCVW
jgi:hypothetical protein